MFYFYLENCKSKTLLTNIDNRFIPIFCTTYHYCHPCLILSLPSLHIKSVKICIFRKVVEAVEELCDQTKPKHMDTCIQHLEDRAVSIVVTKRCTSICISQHEEHRDYVFPKDKIILLLSANSNSSSRISYCVRKYHLEIFLGHLM